MFKRFKTKRSYPPFKTLHEFSDRNKYFVRTAGSRALGKDHISIIDPHGPRIFTLDPWPELIFMSADGLQTIEEYIYDVADKYSGKIPEELDKTILGDIQTLLRYNLIRLSDQKGRPDSSFDKAMSA